MTMIQSINPATEELIASYDPMTMQQVEEVLAEARQAFLEWRETSIDERAALVRKAGEHLRANQERYAMLATAEMGKPITQAEAEVEKSATGCDFYADNGAHFLADRAVDSPAHESYVSFQPLGVVLAVMPWNFPYWQAFRCAIPALMAGNTVVLKHASNVTGCARAIEEVFTAAGFPDGVFRTLVLESKDVDRVIEDPRIVAVALTGSDVTGSKVAAKAGALLKKTVLELGGSDPFIVLDDADVEGAVDFAVRSRFQNAGQSCIAAKRFLVVETIADRFEHLFKEAAEALVLGDPTDRNTKMGPLARADLREGLEQQCAATIEQGAKLVTGGKRLDRKGYYYAPTLLSDVTPEMPAFREETFGPLAAIIRVKDVDEAISLANDSPYGLGGNIWTRDVARAKELARRVESGTVSINGMVASHPRLPFGGVKRSGYGRELSSFGIREFTNIQAVWIEQGPAA
jgi:succinate-semialdehyde dehydrogenase/glutarate-semialdehyde dehydrogenase